ncbi:type IV pilus assembly protein PilM [Jonesia denitrificans]|uniref:Type IV pilus assembly protein PilM n=1 Tax=Jonesia denitrificans (strain ATCC 14870 / DSM 20603 / BCRC 15368 / CIP 55.134 / JCM 11481 / NBRC 15587 / NCTC 10816 / Prevot 55134) TaxID=471856 RepID=C7R4D8_JONDD|nr:type IV pilus assembly protein PilM [Jonesia denitrificans]ACV08995.1 type IV pilus assembly protein PilM [Jonesia denitrificans DSM 20603]QXB44247.1 type IV pilus assembly protein PilM [Jonesia denitrificans]SQH21095.1 Cell division protein FtsA [Jonesia denitrificans]
MARTSTIGLDIGSTAVRAAQLEFGSGGPGSTPPTLSAYAQLPLPAGVMQDGVVVEPDKVASAVKALWQVGKFSAHDVVMGVGNQHVIVREADLAWQPMNVLKKSLPYQAQDLLPVASGDAVFDFVPTGEFESEEGRRMSGLLVAAIRDMVSANVRAAEAGGVRPLMVDLNPLAIQRAQTQGELKKYTAAFVDVGARITNVVIAERGLPRFVRVLPHGSQECTDALAHTMSSTVEDAERMKRELGVGYPTNPERQPLADVIMNVTSQLIESVRSTFVYYGMKNLGAPIDVVVLTGGGALLNGFGQYLSSAVRLPVQMGNPFDGVTVKKGVDLGPIRGNEQVATVALGLAYGDTK